MVADTGDPEFSRFVTDPTLLQALAQSESGGDCKFDEDIGFSSALQRSAHRLGLFRMNDRWAADRWRVARDLIGPTLIARAVPVPLTGPPSLSESKASLLSWPGQLWCPMVLLRQYTTGVRRSLSFAGQHAAATSTPYHSLAAAITAKAALLGVPAELVALRAWWEDSSPAGMLSALDDLADPAQFSTLPTAYGVERSSA